ncbi:MAG: FliA/WhiG family RNA polymerase sigma factor [Clostridiales bacterium]|nr:FliA/WhiG family RNA polymerase sigma factor [Clostridiales bacterium]
MVNINNDMDKLWHEFFKNKTVELKNEIVLAYVFLVKKIVFRMMPTYEGHSNFDDMLSNGIIGLMDAVDKYDLKRNVKFEHYATMRIRGEIIDQIRKQDWAPSSLRRKIKAISNAYSELENTYFRTPTELEVAHFLGIEEEDLKKTIHKSHMFNVVHFEELLSSSTFSISNVTDKGTTVEQQVEKGEMKTILGNMIDNLEKKEKIVITLYYYEEMTLREIAEVLGVTESRVSQIHSKVILKLRTKMKSVG